PPLPPGAVPQVGVAIGLLYSPSLNAVFLADQGVDYSAAAQASAQQAKSQMQLNGALSPADNQGEGFSGQNAMFTPDSLWVNALMVTNDSSTATANLVIYP